jgi:hypothetical protein
MEMEERYFVKEGINGNGGGFASKFSTGIGN